MSIRDLDERIERARSILMKVRAKRIRPGLDDKSLTSWNALMLKAYLDAYNVFKEEEFLKIALKSATFIVTRQRREDGGLFHSYKEGRTTINGFLEDYAFTCEAFIALYESTFDEKWLEIAKELLDYSIAHFFDSSSGMFYFTSILDPDLVARKMELHDNVIPASNSSMAKSLFRLGHYYNDQAYSKISIQMLNNVKRHMITYPSGYSNWGMLMLDNVSTFYEVAIVGKDAAKKRMELNDYYIPNKLYIGSNKESKLPLLQNKFVVGKSIIYVCVNKSCKLPVSEVAEAVKLLK
ncbi:MAG TPA: thioredoxin domain-containing protein [Bacteroidetes bacterium]|nr:thioredoxin domain-containing protein [Bacteroidota bacterium]